MTLLALQRDFRRWLTHEAPDAAARLGADADAAPGLSVYLNNYRGQLMAVLGETYATLRAWLGATAFDRAAALHVERCPPRHWTIDAYAQHRGVSLETARSQLKAVLAKTGMSRQAQLVATLSRLPIEHASS